MSSYFTDVLLTKNILFLWLSDVQVFAILCTCVLAALQDILSENPDKKLQNVDVYCWGFECKKKEFNILLKYKFAW